MSEEEFLTRWSRRKREARENAAPPEPEKPADAPTEPLPPATEGHESEVDVSSLPSIDSITSATDVTAFLRKGIPQQLTRAALRRAWETDPAIRDFVGLAENAWDFNDPNAMPGFGPLDCSTEELAALVDRIVGGVRKAAESFPVESDDPADSSRESHPAEAPTAMQVVDRSGVPESTSGPVAAQPKVTQDIQPRVAQDIQDDITPVPPPRHGGALPR